MVNGSHNFMQVPQITNQLCAIKYLITKNMETRNLSQIAPRKIGSILGYNIYVPDSYFNPLAYMKKNCPIWIQINDKGDCLIHVLQKDNYDDTEIVNFIRVNLEPRSGIACEPLSEEIKEELKLSTNDDYRLNCMVQDYENNVKAVITVDKKRTFNGYKMFISNIWHNDIPALQELREYLFREENISKYRGEIIWYKPSAEEDLTDILHFNRGKNGMSFLQFE